MHFAILHKSVYRSSTIAVQTHVESLGRGVFSPEKRGNKGCLGPLKRGYILNAESGSDTERLAVDRSIIRKPFAVDRRRMRYSEGFFVVMGGFYSLSLQPCIIISRNYVAVL